MASAIDPNAPAGLNIVGDEGNNYREGQGGNDTISGLGGNDDLVGLGGDDSILGGGGDDALQGGAGCDTLLGGLGGDFISPGAGDDTVEGGPDDGFDQIVYLYDAMGANALLGVTVTFSSEFDGSVVDFAGDTDVFTSIDRVWGTNNADTFMGAVGNQQFAGFAGDDTFQGGDGDRDRIDYSREQADNGAIQGIVLDMAAGTATDSYGDTDTFTDIEEVTGNEFDDLITGDDERNTLVGNEGNDTLIGGGGDDNIRGGDGDDLILGGEGGDFIEPGTGTDTIDGETRGAVNGWWNELAYTFSSRGEGATGGITAIYTSEFAGTVTDYAGDTDTFQNIDRIWGTDNADRFVGTVGEQRFVGFAGNDTFDGGDGEDWLRYDEEGKDGAPQGIVVDLALGTATDAYGDTDTLLNIEHIEATNMGDLINGSDVRNRLKGKDGDDTLFGNGGRDNINGGDGNDFVDAGADNDFIEVGAGSDTVDGGTGGVLGEFNDLSYFFSALSDGATMGITVTYSGEFAGSIVDYTGSTDVFENINRVWGTENVDVFVGTNGHQRFSGFGGNDTFDGGAGSDRVDYSRETNDAGGLSGIVADLTAGTATDAFGDTDTLISIEEVRGTDFNDIITGDRNENDLLGEGGDDLISSVGGGRNSLRGGGGNDTLNAQGDNDYVSGGDGNDLITFTGVGGYAEAGLGSDTIIGGSDGYFSIGYDDVGESIVADTDAGRVELSGGDVDTLINIRNIGGGDGDDTIIGDDGSAQQEFFSSRGNDFFDGKGGGRDWIIYDDSSETSININFQDGIATGAYSGTDTFVNIEGARGTRGADTFIGRDSDTTIFQGLDGVDIYQGGTGTDRIDFSFDDNRGGLGAITIDLQLGTATDGFGNEETLTSIEQATGSDLGDSMLGNQDDNFFGGRDGDDTLDGRDGDDFMLGGRGIDLITLGAGEDIISGRAEELDGDVITDFTFEDAVYVFDDSYGLIAANLSIVGDQLRVDTDGDGTAEASMTLLNGYAGPVTSVGGDVAGTSATVFGFENPSIFAETGPEGDSGSAVITITVLRTGDTSSTASVNVTLEGTGVSAVDGSDIAEALNTPQTITFAPGVTFVDVPITILGDTEIEASETLEVVLSTPTSDGALPAEIDGASTFVRILNDDVGETVKIEGGRNAEDEPALEFTVSRTGDTSSDLIVNYTTRSAGGTQGAEDDDLIGGINQTGFVTILAGETSAALKLDIAQDTVAELHDNVIVSIAPDASWPANLSISGRQATGSIRNDDGVPPDVPLGATAASFGDPHIVTLDGLNYSFQAVGEFTLIEAASGDPLLVQVRYQPVPGSDLVSQTEAVATHVGSARVVVDVTGDDLIRVDGTALDFDSASGGADVGDGQVFFDGEAVTIVYGNGEQLRVDLADGFLNVALSIGENRDVRGLLGNADGDTANDLALPDGTILTQPLSYDDLYGTFANGWRIDNATSLFDYAAGKSTEDFTNLSFPIGQLDLGDFPETLVLEAEAVAQAAGITDPALLAAAILDSLVTGDPESAILAAQNAPDVVDTIQVQSAPLINSAIGVIADTAEILEGNSGTTGVFFTVYRTGDVSETLSVDVALGGTFSTRDIVGETSGTLEFAAFEEAKVVEIGLAGDTLFESDDTLVFFITVADTEINIINMSTTTIVLDDDAKPEGIFRTGDAADNTWIGGDGDDTLDGANGNDSLAGGIGDDDLIGGEGIDTALFSGNQAAFTLTLSPGAVEIEDRTRDGQGTDTLISIEFLDFDQNIDLFGDNPMDLDIFSGPAGLSAAEFGAIIELYIAYFNRAPDALGLLYWGTRYAEGHPLS
ncbi:VWD domain-containing protein, partial [Sulfitobacter mediterraneus]